MENVDQMKNQTDDTQKGQTSVKPGDDLAFGLLMNRVMGGSSDTRPSDNTGSDAAIETLLTQGNNLSRMNDTYVQTYVIKGTKELYKLLGAIYSYALQIDASPLRADVLKRMRKVLEQKHEVKTQANTPWLTTVLRFILPSDRQTAYNYSRVLQVAFDENLNADELPTYLERRGGISNIKSTEEASTRSAEDKKHKSAKVTMLRKVLQANSKVAEAAPTASQQFLDLVPKGGEKGEFEYAICAKVGDETRVIRLLHLPASMEKSILSSMADFVVDDNLEDMQDKLDQLRQQLGITNGWGMEPGDKGFALDGVPAVDPNTPQA